MLRATLHDRSATEAKKLLLDGNDLACPGQEDLSTKLGLRRSPQLFVDFWKESWGQQRSPYLVNPAGTSAAYYYIEGEEPMEWILVPTNAR